LSDFVTTAEEAEINFSDRFVFFYHLAKQRLCERGFIPFVVAEAAVANHIDNHVTLKNSPEIHRQKDHAHDRLGIIAVNVENRTLEHFADIRRVRRRSGFLRSRGKADLVIDDDVKSAASRVSAKSTQVQSFLYDSFARKAGIAVDHYGHAALPLAVAGSVLLGAHAPERDRIDEFEMTGIEAERHVDLTLGRGFVIIAMA
jgi:hypothetical protein